jgi:predicted esterase
VSTSCPAATPRKKGGGKKADTAGAGDGEQKKAAATAVATPAPSEQQKTSQPTTADSRPSKKVAGQKHSTTSPENEAKPAAAADNKSSGTAARAKASKKSVNPSSLPLPYIVPPSSPEKHVATLIMLHGFTSSGKSYGSGWTQNLRQRLGADVTGGIKFVWLNAPVRVVSCYGDDRPRLPAWHDYLTDHGGEEGCPEIEEEIDEAQLKWSREQIHARIDAEAELLLGDYTRIAIGGQSQGCCMALDAALTHPRGAQLGGVFASFGQVYKCTPAPADRLELRICAFNGAADRVIAASLSMRSYAKLIDAGYHSFSTHVEAGLGHCEASEAEGATFAAALERWGFTELGPPVAKMAEEEKKKRARKKGKKGMDLQPSSDAAAVAGGAKAGPVANAAAAGNGKDIGVVGGKNAGAGSGQQEEPEPASEASTEKRQKKKWRPPQWRKLKKTYGAHGGDAAGAADEVK